VNILLRLVRLVEFFGFYAVEVVLSNLRVAIDVMTPRFRGTPGIVEVPVGPGLTDRQLTVLANLITMAPGTLSLGYTPDRSCLIIHAMYLGDREAFVKDIRQNFERRVRRVF
jgi:multicomponent Na+:H+ antiporter subunit E